LGCCVLSFPIVQRVGEVSPSKIRFGGFGVSTPLAKRSTFVCWDKNTPPDAPDGQFAITNQSVNGSQANLENFGRLFPC
jgi:hypothetical protein